MFARRFSDFFQPASANAENLLGSSPNIGKQLQESMDAQIRALTKGDITKEKEILSLDTWRALTELNAQAKEYKQINAQINAKNDWSATDFFQNLVANNKLAVAEGFTFCKVSGLEGFEEALHAIQQATAFCCVSDIADGYTELNNTPRTRRIKTVFLAMRHAIDDMDARNECMEIMRELFRQLMSVLTLERVKLEQNCIYLDPRISFNEIDRYFFSGCACAYFQIAVDVFTDLRYNADEWR